MILNKKLLNWLSMFLGGELGGHLLDVEVVKVTALLVLVKVEVKVVGPMLVA